jgi:two-component system, NtrC family, sensor kinase
MNSGMTNQGLRRFSLIKSLKGKFFLALLTIALLNLAIGSIAIYALRAAVEDSNRQAETHLETMQNGQKLLEHSIMIEHQLQLLFKGESREVDRSYSKILEQLDSIDAVVANLGHSTSGPAILDLHQINQLFRNSVHIVARLRSETHDKNSSQESLDKKNQVLNQYQLQLDNQIETMIITSDELASRVNYDYRQTVDELISKTEYRQNIVLSFMLASLISILLIGLYLRSTTIARLQKIIFYLRHAPIDTSAVTIPVHGDDEIGEIARALEKLQEDYKSKIVAQDTNKYDE